MRYFIIFLFCHILNISYAQKAYVYGKITNNKNEPINAGIISFKGTKFTSESNEKGYFSIKNMPFNTYSIIAFSFGKQTIEKNIEVNKDTIYLEISLSDLDKNLDEVVIYSENLRTFGITKMRSVENFGIYEGKKSEVVVLSDINANLATNNPRQVYAKVTGLNIWESDGTGLQLGIGGRGLSPNRTSNFNTRQNGYDISADALGYPESYYTPPTEALQRIEIVRGAASLQYGTQFGGMLNFKFKTPNTDKKIELISRQSVGSWGFYGTFNSISGAIANKKIKYYSFYQYKRGDGYRPNSQFNYHNIFGSIDYTINSRWNVNIEITKMHYLAKQAGGLTDRLFQSNPEQSIRNRNWFKVDWNLLSLNSTYVFSPRTQINTRNFGLIAARQSIGNLDRINVIDNPNSNRTMIDGDFKNIGNETRLLHRYDIQNQHHTLLVGTRIYHGTTFSKQGDANASNKPDFHFLNPDNLENSDYQFPNRNYAIFAENIFNINSIFSLTPGVRAENIQTFSDGYYKQVVRDAAGNIESERKITENLSRKRNFILFGLGASLKYNENIEYYANFSQNYRAINFSDLRVVNPNFVVDANIQDEKGFTADLGVRGQWQDKLTFEATAFYLGYNGRIGQVLRADRPPLYNDYRYRGNIADARNVGVETFVEADMIKFLSPKMAAKEMRWTVFSNLAWVDARYINTQDNSIKNKKVEMVPPIMWRTGTTFKYKKWSSTLQWAFTAEHYSDATNAVRTAAAVEGLIPSYSVADWSVSYTWKFLTAEGSCNNLLNTKYFTRRAESYPGPGIIPSDARGFYVSLQAKF